MKPQLIKKLRLKKGCQYILIVPESAGLTPYDLENIDNQCVRLSIMVKTSRGIKVIEALQSKQKK